MRSDGSTIDTGTEGRLGIERAFDVIRNHTVHTKGYVLTALKLIDEFGTAQDKAQLTELLKEKNQLLSVATSMPPTPKKKGKRS